MVHLEQYGSNAMNNSGNFFSLLWCAQIIHEYSVHSDLWILSDQADQVLFPYFSQRLQMK